MMKSKEMAAYALLGLRLTNKMSRTELARKTMYNNITLARIEKGESAPTLEVLQAYAKAFNMTTSKIVEKTEDEQFAILGKRLYDTYRKMNNSANFCMKQKDYIIAAAKRKGYRSFTKAMLSLGMGERSPWNFKRAYNDGRSNISAMRDYVLYQFVKGFNMKYDEKEGFWK